ncbi:MAG: hypothetical protein GXO42_01955 [bacterium]|nr:hypothetical protein [bacterium]
MEFLLACFISWLFLLLLIFLCSIKTLHLPGIGLVIAAFIVFSALIKKQELGFLVVVVLAWYWFLLHFLPALAAIAASTAIGYLLIMLYRKTGRWGKNCSVALLAALLSAFLWHIVASILNYILIVAVLAVLDYIAVVVGYMQQLLQKLLSWPSTLWLKEDGGRLLVGLGDLVFLDLYYLLCLRLFGLAAIILYILEIVLCYFIIKYIILREESPQPFMPYIAAVQAAGLLAGLIFLK